MNNSSMNDTAYKMYNFLGSERNGNGSYITAPPFVCVREILINIVLWIKNEWLSWKKVLWKSLTTIKDIVWLTTYGCYMNTDTHTDLEGE